MTLEAEQVMLKVEQEMKIFHVQKLFHCQSKTEITIVHTQTILPSSSYTSPATFHLLCCHEQTRNKTRTKHKHHTFTSHQSSTFSICVHLPQHSNNVTWRPRSHHLADIRNARSSRNSLPSLLRCYMKLFLMKWAAVPRSCPLALAGFSQPALFLQHCHLEEVDYRWMTGPTKQIPQIVSFLGIEKKHVTTSVDRFSSSAS